MILTDNNRGFELGIEAPQFISRHCCLVKAAVLLTHPLISWAATLSGLAHASMAATTFNSPSTSATALLYFFCTT
jgi:hypothetical protein